MLNKKSLDFLMSQKQNVFAPEKKIDNKINLEKRSELKKNLLKTGAAIVTAGALASSVNASSIFYRDEAGNLTDIKSGSTKIILKDQELTQANWYLEGGKYKYNFTNSNIVDNSCITITPNIATESIAQSAQIYSYITIDFATNTATLVAQNRPLANIIVDVVIM